MAPTDTATRPTNETIPSPNQLHSGDQCKFKNSPDNPEQAFFTWHVDCGGSLLGQLAQLLSRCKRSVENPVSQSIGSPRGEPR
jgi:hypothetical protein